MPYRRLPNTDKARYRALQIASEEIGRSNKAVLPSNIIVDLRAFFPKYKTAYLQVETARLNQREKKVSYNATCEKARLYVSHFIQVLNFSILRGEIKPEVKELYQLGDRWAGIKRDNDILKWGKRVIEGEQKRMAQGGNPIYNPSIALVRIHVEKFEEAFHSRTPLQKAVDHAVSQLELFRCPADELILAIWNAVESHYEDFPAEEKRRMAEKYGVSYVFRKKELEKEKANSAQGSFNF